MKEGKEEIERLRLRIRELEDELVRSSGEDRFRLVVESAPNGILVANREGRIVMVNQRAEELFGYSREEFEALKIEALVPRRFREGHGELRESFHEGPSTRPMGAGRDLHAVRKDGSEFPVEIALTPLPDETDALVLASIVDITERKRAQDELRRYADELERSNEELEGFASVASHDLQEPLRKIRTMGERLLHQSRDSLDERGLDYLDRMVRAGDNMQRLIRDLLEFSRVSTRGKSFRQINLLECVEEAVSNLEVTIEERNAVVRLGELPTLDADFGQMRQLFQNLVANAVKFHRDGVEPVVEIKSVTERSESQSWAVISVKDNGIGFDERYRDRIFAIFQRLHGKGQYEGTGIGLAICKKIAERHGGVISASSRSGEGSEFLVRLPLERGSGDGE